MAKEKRVDLPWKKDVVILRKLDENLDDHGSSIIGSRERPPKFKEEEPSEN